jgi:TPR repeat protein
MKRYGTVILALAAIATLCAARLSPATASAFDVIETPNDASPSRQRVAQFVLMTKRAAENDNCGAMNTLGVLYASGDAIEQDYTAALYWFLEAIDRGSVDAMNNVARLYFFGMGVPQSYSNAAIWSRRAAGHGSVVAMYNMALMSEEGLGVNWSQTAAQEYYVGAAHGGYVPAMLALGERYARGQGVKRDLILAYAWTATALLSGQPDKYMEQALHKLAHLRFALSGEKLSRAQLLSVHLSTLVELRPANSATDAESAVFSGRR